MNDHLLVAALCERDPGAPAALYDAHADRLYAYCWFQLRSRDAAQVALRDTLIVAEAHIGKLRDPDRFAPWLYAIARLECARRLPPTDHPPDVPIASHDQEDVDQRIMAWQAVLALLPVSREILELRVRHQLAVPDLAAVFDVPLKDAQSALDRAHGELAEALTAEMLAHQGPYGCAERAALLRERHGVDSHTGGANGRLAEHAEDCSVCGAFRPRTVSATKVYGLLPEPDLAAELRLRVMSCFLDPELVGYRLFVTTRITGFTPDGFPVQAMQPARPPWASSPGGHSCLRRLRRTRSLSNEQQRGSQAVRGVVVLAVVALLSGGGIASMYGLFDTGRRDADTVAGPRPSAVPGLSQYPVPGRRSADHPEGAGYLDAAPVSATFPLGSTASSAPPTALRTPSPAPAPANDHSSPAAKSTLLVSPLFLDLAGDSDGSIELRAESGSVTWRARSQGAVGVHPSSGRLAAGQSVTVRVQVSRKSNSGGDGTITFQPGGSQVHVTWRPDAPGADPTPSPSPTPTGPGHGYPSTPPGTHRPGRPSPSHRETPPSPNPSPSGPPPSGDGPDPSPSTEASSGATAVSPSTSSPSGP
ncbi:MULTISPECIES: RNA polymerase sigma factor [unclassified Spirillospora]|uniref:RNA polymerase sigma factor n=1 Tax=unclassified Spirillospora TaxID=2642701 RepID=UPI0037220CFB